jgi:hypothetical protein
MAVSPLIADQSIPNFSIKSNNKAIGDQIMLSEIKIKEGINQPGIAEITVPIPGADFTVLNEYGDCFKAGSQVEIALGYGGSNDIVFKGVVTNRAVQADDKGTFITIICRNENIYAPPYNTTTAAVLLLTYGSDISSITVNRNEKNPASVLTKFIGQACFPGTALAKPNSMLRLSKLGNLFLEDVFISAVEHLVKDGNWQTTATIGLPEL